MSKVRNKKTNFSAIGKLLRFAKPYVPAILLALFFSILQIVATLFTPVIIGKTVDFIIGKDNVDFSVIAKNAGILAGLIAAVLLFQYLSSLCINFASFRTIRDLRREAFKKLNVVPLSYIDSNSHGDLMSRVGNDVDQISDGLIQGFSQLFGGIVTIVGTLVFMLTYNWLIAVIVVVLTPISLFVAYFIAKGCHDTFAKQAEKRGELSGLVTEMTSNQRVVKLFGYEKRAEERFAVINQELKISGQNAAFFSALVNPCTRFVNNVIYAVVCILGAWLVIRGQGILGMGAFTVGGLSCVLSYAIQYTKPFNEITGVVTELQTATAAADRVFNLLETENQSSDEGFPDLENGYDTVLGDDGGNVSQGQKQLLCIARVMLTHPPMLILDEATSSIDTRTELKIQQAFEMLMKGKTSFIVAHRLSTIKNADLILVMNKGNVIEKGTHDELIEKHGFYYNLYNSQFEH